MHDVRILTVMNKNLPKNAPKLRKQLNELARKLYASLGYVTPEGFDFQNSSHPQERLMFKHACDSYEFWGKNMGRIFWRNEVESWKES